MFISFVTPKKRKFGNVIDIRFTGFTPGFFIVQQQVFLNISERTNASEAQKPPFR
jgi:hypothetical protein